MSERIQMLSIEDSRKAAEQAGVPVRFADLSVFRTLLHRPAIAKATADLLLANFSSELDHRLRELVIMRLGWATGSVYEWTQHWPIALRIGATEDDLLGVRDWRSHDGFGPAERAVLAATDETLADGTISDETWNACVEHVSPEPAILLELVSAIGLWRMVSGLLRSTDVPLEDGVAPWPPDGATP